MTESIFSGHTYITSPGSELLLHRLLLRNRIYYIARFIIIVFQYWPQAQKGRFDFANWHKAAFGIFRMVEQCGGRFKITGLSNLRATDGPVVFVANHMSAMETLILPAFIYPYKKPIYVIKEQLLKVPFFANYLKECIAVTRKSPAEDFRQVMRRGSEIIAQDRSIIVFPQAMRTVDFNLTGFNTLGIKLARKAGVPVIPIALKTDFWGNGKILKDFGPLALQKTIYIEFGSPIHIQGSGKEAHEQVTSFIKNRLEAWWE